MGNADLWLAELTRHRETGVVIDTQLLLLLWIGSFDRSLVGRFKRIQRYEETDFDLLSNIVARCPRLVTTPNVLTEVGNLAGQLPEEIANEFRGEFRLVVKKMDERLLKSAEVVEDDAFLRLGLADSTIINLARQNMLVLTDDFPLYAQLIEEKLHAINFTHVRASAYDWPKR
jgi:rRNA-processing protein FCF1